MTTANPYQSSLSELLRRVEFTSKTRYNAARRLQLHNTFSQWTLAGLAIGQIVISLISALNLSNNYSAAYTNFGGIFFGILVLAYSLLLGMGNYAARSITMHTCGMELGELARQMHFEVTDPNSNLDTYKTAYKKYYSILSKCENHALCDYLQVKNEMFLQGLQNNKLRLKDIFKSIFYTYDWINEFFLVCAQFVHYLFTIALMTAWILFMIIK